MPKFIECEQGSDVWLKARIGRITASRLADVLSTRKDGKEAAPRANYRQELVAERLTGMSTDHFVSKDMDWGSANEDMACAAYELAFDIMLDKVGFAVHPSLEFSGASPDRLIGDDGVLEVKCPKTTTHIGWLTAGVVPPEYIPQMMWEMACTERKFADFLSYDPRIEDPALQTFCVRLEFDEVLATAYKYEVCKFEEEIQAIISKLKKSVEGA